MRRRAHSLSGVTRGLGYMTRVSQVTRILSQMTRVLRQETRVRQVTSVRVSVLGEVVCCVLGVVRTVIVR